MLVSLFSDEGINLASTRSTQSVLLLCVEVRVILVLGNLASLLRNTVSFTDVIKHCVSKMQGITPVKSKKTKL